MPYSKNINYPTLSNTRINSRLRQVMILIGTILLGMIISVAVNAKTKIENQKELIIQEQGSIHSIF